MGSVSRVDKVLSFQEEKCEAKAKAMIQQNVVQRFEV